jgi:NOL1/NOP2/fmu family ribosome biogenesis protein
VGLISGLALGGLTLLIGPHKVAAGLHQIRVKAQTVIDQVSNEPAALRHQLQVLADQYPDRIATVRGELVEVNHELAEFERDSEVSARVVAMTTEDLVKLKTLVVKARNVSNTTNRDAFVRFKGIRFDVDQAYCEGNRINSVRVSYQDRLASDQQQTSILTEQKGRLVEILTQLESDYSTFQDQMWQLDRQIDAIERNERLIEMTEELQATLSDYDSWGKIGNLKQLTGKLAQLRTVQQAQLETLRKTGIRWDYAKKAAQQLDANSVTIDYDFASDYLKGIDVEDSEETSYEESDKIAWLDQPRIIEE